jgi:hypothetical protein
MRKDGKETRKGNRTKKSAVKDLAVKDAKAVKGGATIVIKRIDKSTPSL